MYFKDIHKITWGENFFKSHCVFGCHIQKSRHEDRNAYFSYLTRYLLDSTRREFFREILYKNIAIIAIQHSNMYFVDTSGDFSHTVG